MILYKGNQYPYYSVEDKQDKAYVLAVLAKYGIELDKPNSRVPFFVSIDSGYDHSANPPTATYKAGVIKHQKDCYGAIAPLSNFEDDVILECRKRIALEACQSVAVRMVLPDMRESRVTTFTSKDGRIFEVYTQCMEGGSLYYNVNLRDESYFRLSTMERRIEAVAIDYVKLK